MKQLIIFILSHVRRAVAQARTGLPANDAEPLRRATAAVTDIMVHDIFSPPVASRIYLYTSVAAYETLAKGQWREYASLHGQVKGFPGDPHTPRGKYRIPLAAVYAYLLVGKRLIFSESVMEDSIRSILSWYRSNDRSDTTVYTASLEYGRQIAAAVIGWAETDQYTETRRLPRYRISRQKGKWIPTPPTYMAAVEPYWDKIRPVTLDSADQFRPLPAPAFSTDTASLFYHQAYEVYQAGNMLTGEQKDIANFWDCNPFAVTMEGHVGFATKKISPGGHWMSIVTTVSRQRRLDIMETAAAYTITSIAIFDAIISCRAEKFRSNVIRPETYIDAYIAEGWRPLLQTPPFPEYTSGHSIISMVSATVLTRYFGDHFAFDDDTEIRVRPAGKAFRFISAGRAGSCHIEILWRHPLSYGHRCGGHIRQPDRPMGIE